MKDEQKVFIRGVEGRGEEVMKMLTDLGAVDYDDFEAENPECLYYINHDGEVDFTSSDNEEGQIIMDNYTELHLPEKWKDGDVLVSDEGLFFVLRGDFELGVKKEHASAYCCVSEHQICLSGHIEQIDYPHLASPSEVEHFHELMHKYGKDWDAGKKQVIDWRWKPKEGDRYYIIGDDGDVVPDTWDGCDLDADRYNFGNCFRTEEEAKAMAEKVKKLLKGE